MKAIVKLLEQRNWVPVLSATSLPPAVLETKDGQFFGGFVAASLRDTTGAMETGKSKYSKGLKAYQTFCVQKKYGKCVHLATGGMDKVIDILATKMAGFTKNYWGLRSSIIALFKDIRVIPVDNLASFMRSRTEIEKGIKTKFLYENGGVFRPEEIAYLSARFTAQKEAHATFMEKLSSPTDEFARGFQDEYARIAAMVKQADDQVRITYTARSRILFPTDKKKATLRFLKLSLPEKILTLSKTKRGPFLPESLPGIVQDGEPPANAQYGSIAWRQGAYPSAYEVGAADVVNSFFNSLPDDESEEEDEA